jgi:hypothetical protein
VRCGWSETRQEMMSVGERIFCAGWYRYGCWLASREVHSQSRPGRLAFSILVDMMMAGCGDAGRCIRNL